MRYLWSSKDNKIYTCDDTNIDDMLAAHPEDREVDEENAYMLLFYQISKTMGKKFHNYKNADIQGEVLMMMINRYRSKGLYAPDKSFNDNKRIWYSYAKKSCFFIIRQFNRRISKCESIDNMENLDNMCADQLLYEESMDFEGDSVCKEMKEFFEKLSHSKVYSEMQLGIYALSKIGGLTDDDIMEILDIKYGRIKEIRAELRETIRHRFRNI